MKKVVIIAYCICLIIFTLYVVLNTFILKSDFITVPSNNINASSNLVENNEVENETYDDEKESNANITFNVNKDNAAFNGENGYLDDNIRIDIEKHNYANTTILVADIKLSNSKYLKTALANNMYGRNIKQPTSEIASSVKALLAINGDFYGAREKGYVIRNGVVYRNIKNSNHNDLAIYQNGEMEIINENYYSSERLLENGVYNLLSFGPVLINNYDIVVSQSGEGKDVNKNPRTAIGMIEKNHYIFVVCDGRTRESTGLTVYQLALFMQKLNVKIAYNLDGGGSTTMYFRGKILNKPTTNGRDISERSISDIVYIGYE